MLTFKPEGLLKSGYVEWNHQYRYMIASVASVELVGRDETAPPFYRILPLLACVFAYNIYRIVPNLM